MKQKKLILLSLLMVGTSAMANNPKIAGNIASPVPLVSEGIIDVSMSLVRGDSSACLKVPENKTQVGKISE